MKTSDSYLGEDKEGEMRELLLETLRTATILSVEHKRDEIPIDSFDRVLSMRGKETLTITFVASEPVPDFKMTKKKEKEDRKTIGEALVKKKPK